MKNPSIDPLRYWRMVLLTLSCSAFILSGSLSAAEDKEKANIVPMPATERVTRLLNDLRSFDAKFTQKIYDERQRLLNENQGRFQLSRPNQFRWEIISPFHELLIAKDKELWVIDYDLEQVTRQNLGESLGDTPALLLSQANANVEKNFQVKYIGSDEDGREIYKLTPKDKGSMFESMTLTFRKESLLELWLKDGIGQTTLVNFYESKINQPIASETFEFVPNKSMDIIDAREKP
ncbi:MAG: outer membrane lipoprotein chaperone LolA [Pseudomonadota bacterium]